MIRMTFNKVLLKHHEAKETTPGGIILPEARQLKDQPIADVVAVGPDVKGVVPGDTVYFGTYAGTVLVIDDEEHMVLREEDILAVINGNDT